MGVFKNGKFIREHPVKINGSGIRCIPISENHHISVRKCSEEDVAVTWLSLTQTSGWYLRENPPKQRVCNKTSESGSQVGGLPDQPCQPLSTIVNHHQPLSAIINHYQPSSTIINSQTFIIIKIIISQCLFYIYIYICIYHISRENPWKYHHGGTQCHQTRRPRATSHCTPHSMALF